MMVIYCKTEDGNYLKLSIVEEDIADIDYILDQCNLGKFEFIPEDQFYITDPMTIDFLDENNGKKIAELTWNKIDLEPLYSFLMNIALSPILYFAVILTDGIL